MNVILNQQSAETPAIPAKANASQLFSQFDLRLVELPQSAGFEIRTPRIFIEPGIVDAARASEETTGGSLPRGLDSLTYFVNELRADQGSDSGAKSTPYSMVTAIEPAASGFVKADLADEEIQVSQWLADDLQVAPGAKITVKYYVMGERRELVEKARTFTVASPILTMDEPRLNGSWMPDFPGLSDKENCRDWKPGFEFDATRMRDKDQDYWAKYRGTPKAFVTLKIGQELWGNRWGNLTSIRYISPSPSGPLVTAEQVERIAEKVDPAALGFRIVDLRADALLRQMRRSISGSYLIFQLFPDCRRSRAHRDCSSHSPLSNAPQKQACCSRWDGR